MLNLKTYMHICKDCRKIYILTKLDRCRETLQCTNCGGQLLEVEDIDDMSALVSEEI